MPKFQIPQFTFILDPAPVQNGWIVDYDGIEIHYKDNQVHSTNGPAIIHPNGTEEFWCRGEKQESLEDCIIKDIIQ